MAIPRKPILAVSMGIAAPRRGSQAIDHLLRCPMSSQLIRPCLRPN